jgi:hypothetical protein
LDEQRFNNMSMKFCVLAHPFLQKTRKNNPKSFDFESRVHGKELAEQNANLHWRSAHFINGIHVEVRNLQTEIDDYQAFGRNQ